MAIKKQVIVLVDDDKWITDLYSERMHRAGFLVQVAHSGKTGLRLVKKYQPEAVLSDIVMAGGDGFWLVKKIKQDKVLRHIPVIGLSNLSNTKDRHAFLSLGGDGFFIKADLTPVEIIHKIKHAISARAELIAKIKPKPIKRTKVELRSKNFDAKPKKVITKKTIIKAKSEQKKTTVKLRKNVSTSPVKIAKKRGRPPKST
ncbi:MAG: response regulator [Candidatus Falkowbacteria bacterium]